MGILFGGIQSYIKNRSRIQNDISDERNFAVFLGVPQTS